MTTFQNEGVVTEDIVVETLSELKQFLSQKKPFFILGKGSNTVINPEHKRGVCLRLSPDFIQTDAVETRLTVSSGLTVNALLKEAMRFGLSGLEFSAGVPASVGGMIAMNFGCWGTSMSDCVESIYILDLEQNERWILNDDIGFGYRSSKIQDEGWIVLGATFKLMHKDPTEIKALIESMVQLRLKKQPLKEKTFGSVFKNPSPLFAAKLIEDAGLKGYSSGDVHISNVHANFIVNKGKGTYNDLDHVITHVQNYIQKHTGILLELEVKLIS